MGGGVGGGRGIGWFWGVRVGLEVGGFLVEGRGELVGRGMLGGVGGEKGICTGLCQDWQQEEAGWKQEEGGWKQEEGGWKQEEGGWKQGCWPHPGRREGV